MEPGIITYLLLQVGGATGAIGDPSGRLTEREKLESEGLKKNVAGITETLTRIFQNDEGQQESVTAEEPRLKYVVVVKLEPVCIFWVLSTLPFSSSHIMYTHS